jgi:hypothetical protein
MISSLPMAAAIDGPISLNIIIPRHRLRVISLLRSSSIALLKELLPNLDLIFNGQLLNEKCTLEFYNLQPNDLIVALPANPGAGQMERWMRITRDSDTFGDAVRSLLNQKSRTECLRLQDLRAARTELRPRLYRRLCDAERNAPGLLTSRTSATVIPDQRPNASTEPLPACW